MKFVSTIIFAATAITCGFVLLNPPWDYVRLVGEPTHDLIRPGPHRP